MSLTSYPGPRVVNTLFRYHSKHCIQATNIQSKSITYIYLKFGEKFKIYTQEYHKIDQFKMLLIKFKADGSLDLHCFEDRPVW